MRQKENLPNDRTNSGTSGERAAFLLEWCRGVGAVDIIQPVADVIIVAIAEPEGSNRGRPGPGGEPEDDGDGVGDKTDDAEEQVGSPQLQKQRETVDDECLDALFGRSVNR